MTENCKLRMISGSVMLLGALIGILWNEVIFLSMIFALAVLLFSEWYDIAHKQAKLLQGYFLLVPALSSALLIRAMENGEYILTLVLLLIVSVDSFAYFGGKLFGGKKLAPTISPNKTISGLLSGIVGALIVVLVAAMIVSDNTDTMLPNLWIMALLIIVLSLLEQAGDLLASYFKRQLDVKDSGQLIPGHGGVLDRFDGIIFVLPVIYIIAILCY